MNDRGQGSLEYLLLIGGAILVAVIVIGLVISTTGPIGDEAQAQALCGAQATFALCNSHATATNGFPLDSGKEAVCAPLDETGAAATIDTFKTCSVGSIA